MATHKQQLAVRLDRLLSECASADLIPQYSRGLVMGYVYARIEKERKLKAESTQTDDMERAVAQAGDAIVERTRVGDRADEGLLPGSSPADLSQDDEDEGDESESLPDL